MKRLISILVVTAMILAAVPAAFAASADAGTQENPIVMDTFPYAAEVAAGQTALAFGDFSYYWIADRQNRTFKRLNELYARTDQVGFISTQRVDGKLILPEAIQALKMKGTATTPTTGG